MSLLQLDETREVVVPEGEEPADLTDVAPVHTPYEPAEINPAARPMVE